MNRFRPLSPRTFSPDTAALCLRIGLGLVFVIGGYSKLSQLLSAESSAALVADYTGTGGYINAFFLDYLFEGTLGTVLTPWLFLSALSAFELFSGLALLAGFLVRPLALVYAFLLWTFVFSLPVVTTPGVESASDTYTSPALLVQIRDVALSGLMFTLFNLGADRRSVDHRLSGGTLARGAASADWNALGLLVRLSLAAPLLVGGFFVGLDSIQSFATFAPLLIVLGLLLVAGIGVRQAAVAIVSMMAWYALTKVSPDASPIANLNAIKREFALTGAALVLALYGGGERFVWRLPARTGRGDEVAASPPRSSATTSSTSAGV